MDADRLIRYTIHGLFFIFSLIFHYWAIGGDFKHFEFISVFDNDIKAILSFLTTLASSPALGFVTASIGERSLHLLTPMFTNEPLLFKLPNKDESNWYFDALWINLPNLRQEILELQSKLEPSINNSGTNNQSSDYIENTKKIHLLFNLVLRMQCPRELSEFVLRRWNIFWLHINIISAILLGLFFAIFLRIYFDKGISIYAYKFIWQPLFLEIPVIIYFVIAILHLREARRDAVDIEYKWLLNTVSNLRA